MWTTDGVHNPATPGPNNAYLEVQVDHFSTFVAGGATYYGGGGGGGGGCALSRWSNVSPIEFALPLAAFVVVLFTCSIVGGSRRRSGGTRSD
jgi:hypothetical protein